MSPAIALALALGVSAVAMTVTAVAWRRLGRVSIVDVTWGLALTGVAVALAVAAALGGSGLACRPWLLAVLVAVWGSRLSWHIWRRQRGGGEDPRYAEMLGDAAWPVVVGKVFLAQGLAVSLVSLPLVAAAVTPVEWTWLLGVGIAVWLAGVVLETVADAQLTTYKRLPRDSRPLVLDTGLWAWSRHPNYFGDACMWWGLWLAGGLASGWLPGLITVAAPLAMTWYLVAVTGARPLERMMMHRPGYPEYAARTSMFVPLPPRK